MTSVQGPGINRSMYYDASAERLVVRDGTVYTFTLRDLGHRVLREVTWSSTESWRWGKDYIDRGGTLLASQSPRTGEGLRYHFRDDVTPGDSDTVKATVTGTATGTVTGTVPAVARRTDREGGPEARAPRDTATVMDTGTATATATATDTGTDTVTVTGTDTSTDTDTGTGGAGVASGPLPWAAGSGHSGGRMRSAMCEWNRWQVSDALADLDVIHGRICCLGLGARAGGRAARCFAVKSVARGPYQL